MARNINPAQMSFDFPDSSYTKPLGRSAARHDLFFALIPGGDTAERAFRLGWDLHREHGLAAAPRPQPLLHMTLFGIGEIARLPDNAVDLAVRAAAGVGGAAFSMSLDQVFTFRQRHHPLVLYGEDNDAFRMLYIRLGLALRNSGLRVRVLRRMQPHMTLAYGRKPVSKVKLARPIVLTATEFTLVRSHFGEGRHDYLGRWPLLQNEPPFAPLRRAALPVPA